MRFYRRARWVQLWLAGLIGWVWSSLQSALSGGSVPCRCRIYCRVDVAWWRWVGNVGCALPSGCGTFFPVRYFYPSPGHFLACWMDVWRGEGESSQSFGLNLYSCLVGEAVIVRPMGRPTPNYVICSPSVVPLQLQLSSQSISSITHNQSHPSRTNPTKPSIPKLNLVYPNLLPGIAAN